jgi:hypothetical protein
MTPIQLSHLLTRLAQGASARAAMIWGPPGIGKSRIVASVADGLGLDLIDVRISQLAPTDLRGLPVADGAMARWLPPEFLPSQGKGILFLDEINLAPPAVQGIAQQLVLDRRVGSYRVPDGWLVWAAGNRKEDRGAVFDMPAPLANRFLHLDVGADFESFRSWATASGIHEQVLAFLAFRPELLHKLDPNRPAWPSPRSWEMASELHSVGLAIEPAVGGPVAVEFAAFIEVYGKLPDIGSILAGRGKAIAFPEEPSARYALVLGLGMRANSVEETSNALDWLGAGTKMEWLRLFLQTAWDRARSNNQTGRLATLVARDKRVSRFLDEYGSYLAGAA